MTWRPSRNSSAAAATLRSATDGARLNRSRMAEPTAPMVTSAVRAAKLPSSAALGSGRPICRSATSVAGTVSRRSGRNRVGQGPQPELLEGPGGVDKHVALRAESGEEVDLVDQGGVDHDQAIRRHHRLTRPYLALVETAIGDHGGAHPLGPKTGKRLGKPVVFERGERQEFGGGHRSLSTPTVEAHCEHASSVPRPSPGG